MQIIIIIRLLFLRVFYASRCTAVGRKQEKLLTKYVYLFYHVASEARTEINVPICVRFLVILSNSFSNNNIIIIIAVFFTLQHLFTGKFPLWLSALISCYNMHCCIIR